LSVLIFHPIFELLTDFDLFLCHFDLIADVFINLFVNDLLGISYVVVISHFRISLFSNVLLLVCYFVVIGNFLIGHISKFLSVL
jgi:hypothetical protein